ncbi:helix-turn-helix domain-containing protein [Streptomyces sp. NPDC020489]|uniref:helix-turn-helix domain-containing protein n=1 Tax=Streptomyces sp. NPDC020489 TaxID=3365077 RepID=UPI00378FEF89
MALEFDARRAPVRASHYLELVKAIRAASAADESDWLEWKSTLDFRPKNKADKSARAHVARAIIGFANRQPDDALRNVEGHGFLVVGVDPEGYYGVDEIDNVDLEPWINEYVGDGIDWRPTYVHISEEGHDRLPVLIITVSPPNWGDPIFCIRKEIPPPPRSESGQPKDKDTIREATVFVRRRHGRTDRARAADIDRLGERLLRKHQTFDLTLTVKEGEVNRVTVPDDDLEKVIEAVRADLLSHLPPPTASVAGSASRTLDQILQDLKLETTTGMKPDPRGRDGYLEEVELYLEELRRAVPQTLPEVAALTLPAVELRLRNDTRTHLQDVQVRLEMPEGVLPLVPVQPGERERDEPFLRGLLEAPRPYGPMHPMQFARSLPYPLLVQSLPAVTPSVVPSQWDIEVEGTTVVFPAEDVRVGLSIDLPWFVMVTERPLSVTLTLPWTATATNMEGTAQGTVSLPIAPERSLLFLIELLDGADESRDED